MSRAGLAPAEGWALGTGLEGPVAGDGVHEAEEASLAGVNSGLGLYAGGGSDGAEDEDCGKPMLGDGSMSCSR